MVDLNYEKCRLAVFKGFLCVLLCASPGPDSGGSQEMIQTNRLSGQSGVCV